MLADSPVRLRGGTPWRRPDIHVVRRGDTLYSLAQRLGTDVNTLAEANGMSPATGCMRASACVWVRARSTRLEHWCRRARRTQHTAHATGTVVAASDGGRRVVYIVRRGDTLYGIARLLQVTVGRPGGLERH